MRVRSAQRLLLVCTAVVLIAVDITLRVTLTTTPQMAAVLVPADGSAVAAARIPRHIPRAPLCNAATPGHWGGTRPHFEWVYAGCVYAISSPYDFLTAFAGKRIAIVGDSVSREFALDMMRLLSGCATYARGRYTADGVSVRVALGYAAGAAAAAACAHLSSVAGEWVDANVTLPVGSTGEFVDLRFYWLQWPTQLSSKWWWHDVILAGELDAVVFNSYLHVVMAPTAGMSEMMWYERELDWLVGELGGVHDATVRSKLRSSFFWRATFPGEWHEPHYPPFRRMNALKFGAIAATKMRAAGYAVLNFDKFFPVGAIGDGGACNATAEHCVTADGFHPVLSTNVALGWELWSAIASAIATI